MIFQLLYVVNQSNDLKIKLISRSFRFSNCSSTMAYRWLMPILLILIQIISVRSQFEPLLVSKCNKGEVVCAGVKHTEEPNTKITYGTECFPTESNISTCDLMIMGHVLISEDHDEGDVVWIVFFKQKPRIENHCFWLTQYENQDPVKRLRYCLPKDGPGVSIINESIVISPNGKPTDDQSVYYPLHTQIEIESHQYFSFESETTIHFRKVFRIKLLYEPVYIHFDEMLADNVKAFGYATTDSMVLFEPSGQPIDPNPEPPITTMTTPTTREPEKEAPKWLLIACIVLGTIVLILITYAIFLYVRIKKRVPPTTIQSTTQTKADLTFKTVKTVDSNHPNDISTTLRSKSI